MQRRVVVTGMGAISPNGNSAPLMWDAMKNGCERPRAADDR